MVAYGANTMNEMSFKPMGTLTSTNINMGNMTSASSASMTHGNMYQIDSNHSGNGMLRTTSGGILGSSSLGHSNTQYSSKNTEAESNNRRIIWSNNPQSNGNYQQQRTLSSSSNSSIPQTETLKDAQEM